MYEINWTPRAVKQLLKLGVKPIQKEIKNAVEIELPNFHISQNVKRLINHEYDYRLRVGRYRVLFTVEDGILRIVTIEEIKIRNERTY